MHRRAFLSASLFFSELARTQFAEGAQVSYPPVTPGARLIFPRDHGAHPDFRTEWWYVTGALDLPQADIGFQLTFFRSRLGVAETLRSPLAPRQVLFAHAALTLPKIGLRHAERAARPHMGAEFSSSDCDLHIGSWHMARQDTDQGERLRLSAQGPDFSFDFMLAPTQALLLQGDGGYSRKGQGTDLASYYVSWPQLQVSGQLTRNGQQETARGQAWFDHEWSTTLLDRDTVGWDWLGINLEDGGALMAFRLRDARGTTLFAQATWRTADGHVRQFAQPVVSFAPQRFWSSPRSGGRYPVQIEIRFGAHTVQTLPVIDDQELSTRQPRPFVYWEGLIRLNGSLTGRGYLELTGYAGHLHL